MMRSEKWKFGLSDRDAPRAGRRSFRRNWYVLSAACAVRWRRTLRRQFLANRDLPVDHLAYSLNPPTVDAVVDYEGGGRFLCEMTDFEAERVAIGNEVEMTFRRLFTADGVHNYFWKARPKR